tara:strand:- start:2563 stop:2907 length:345 start_codon:yes stop_codon:yes gene_type:complete
MVRSNVDLVCEYTGPTTLVQYPFVRDPFSAVPDTIIHFNIFDWDWSSVSYDASPLSDAGEPHKKEKVFFARLNKTFPKFNVLNRAFSASNTPLEVFDDVPRNQIVVGTTLPRHA